MTEFGRDFWDEMRGDDASGVSFLRQLRGSPELSPRNRSAAVHSDQLLTPLQSMADGKWYDSKRQMLKSYRADGNPQGQNYEIVGDDPVKEYSRPERTRADDEETHAAISRALDEHGY